MGSVDQTEDDTGPLRRCIASGRSLQQAEMLRFVVGPDGSVVFDAAGKLPGRGLWLSAGLDMLKTAAAKNLFAKAARAQVRVPEDLIDEVARILRRRCLDRIGLARGAGQITAGFDMVREAVRHNAPGLLIEARDGSADGRRKIAGLAREAPIVALFTAAELGLAIGRDNAVHMSVRQGKLAQGILNDARRLAGILNEELDGKTGPDPATETE